MSGDVTEDVMLPMTPDDAHLRRTARRLKADMAARVWDGWDSPTHRAIRGLAAAYAHHELGERPAMPGPVRNRWDVTYGWWSDQFRRYGISGGPEANARIGRLLDLVIAEGGQVVHPDRAVSTMPGAMTPAMSPALVAV